MAQEFPQVQPNGSLMIAWQVKNKPVLVVGGGEVAASRILHALNASAVVTIISPSAGLSAEVAHRISQNQISHIDRVFHASDLDTLDPSLVLVAVDDPVASTQIWQLCKQRRIPANIADVPSECDFYFGSVHRDGPLQVMVSTNGNGPRMAHIVRRKIAESLPDGMGGAIGNVGVLRGMLRERARGAEEGAKRMKWISRVCDTWSLEDLVDMNEEDMDALLNHYEKNGIPSLEQVRLEQK